MKPLDPILEAIVKARLLIVSAVCRDFLYQPLGKWPRGFKIVKKVKEK